MKDFCLVYKILCALIILLASVGVFLGLQSAVYALDDKPVALVLFILVAAVVTMVMGRKAFRMTVRRSQVERIAREYNVSIEQAEVYLPILQKMGGKNIPEHAQLNLPQLTGGRKAD